MQVVSDSEKTQTKKKDTSIAEADGTRKNLMSEMEVRNLNEETDPRVEGK